MVFLLIIALVVLGPEKLPDAVRKFGKFYGEFKKMSSGFQSELRNVLVQSAIAARGPTGRGNQDIGRR